MTQETDNLKLTVENERLRSKLNKLGNNPHKWKKLWWVSFGAAMGQAAIHFGDYLVR